MSEALKIEPQYHNHIGVMTICHRRDRYLRAIADNLLELNVPTHWQIFLNRPSVVVLDVVNNLLLEPLYKHLNLEIFDAPFAPLGDRERFMEFRQVQLEQLPPTDWAVIWDDDHLLEDPAEAHQRLQEPWDLIYATKRFFWDDDAHFTTHLPIHRSVFFFRRLSGDRFPLDRTIHAPARIHDTARSITDLAGSLLDFGYMDKYDRERCWCDYKRAGKIDAATLAIVREPELHEWPGPYPLRDTEHRALSKHLAEISPHRS